MDKYKLTYFNLHGRCQHIRYLFAVGKVEYDDHRILFKDWLQTKATTQLGFLPMLEINGKQILSQNVAVGRYVAKVTKLYGSNHYEEGVIDMIVDSCHEMYESFVPVFSKNDESGLDAIVQKCKTTLANLSKILGDKDYFVGNKISWADIHFYHCLEIITQEIGKWDLPQVANLLKDTPSLEKLFARVDQHQEIVKFKTENKKPVIGKLIPRPEDPNDFEKNFKTIVGMEEAMGLK